MTNRLIYSTSPYLLQHAENPVDWQPWDEQALQSAKTQDKPIFLSIGYAACHWCHVMEHESFSDPNIASLMNQYFVNIKVDREERPDLDAIYMSAVVSITGQGGWPMSVFLTPDQKPFYGGTYFPPEPRYGMPSFRQVLLSIARYWKQEQSEAKRIAGELTQHLSESLNMQIKSTVQNEIELQTFQQAEAYFITTYDKATGGWGNAPRFPAPMPIEFLLRQSRTGNEEALQISKDVLDHMRQGGMYDLINGGFCRYSTDRNWLVPHFEKMLSDNAQLARVYLHAYLITGEQSYRRIVQETLDFILAELTDQSGGFYSSLDADSEGVEGKYYLYSLQEIQQADAKLPESLLAYLYLPQNGHESNQYLPRFKSLESMRFLDGQPDQFARLREQLGSIRKSRTRPNTDDKILTSWNALAIQTFSEAARYLDRTDYLRAAQKNADFLLSNLMKAGQLYRSWRKGEVSQPAFLEDHAGLAVALFSLYQAASNPRWYQSALRFVQQIHEDFRAPDGGFYETHPDNVQLISSIKNIQDNVTPSGNALAVEATLLAARFDPLFGHQNEVLNLYASLQTTIARYPSAFAYWLCLSPLVSDPPIQLIGTYAKDADINSAISSIIQRTYLPGSISIQFQSPATTGHAPLLKDKLPIQGQPTAFICQNFTCKFPITHSNQLKAEMDQIGAWISPSENPPEPG